MRFHEFERDALTIIRRSEATESNLYEQYLSSLRGLVYIENDFGKYDGFFSVDNIDFSAEKVSLYSGIRYPYFQFQKDDSLKLRSGTLFKKNCYIGLIPLTDESNGIVGASACDCQEIQSLLEKSIYLLSLYKLHNYRISDYFVQKGYKTIAIWGINEASAAFADALSQDDRIELCGIYDNKKVKMLGGAQINVHSLGADVHYVDSIKDLLDKNIDIIVNFDFYFRKINKILEHFNETVKIIYGIDFILHESKKYYLTDLLEKYRSKLSAVGARLYNVEMPMEDSLGISRKEKSNLTEFYMKELGVDANEAREFGKSAIDVSKHIVKLGNVQYIQDFSSKYINIFNKQRIVPEANKDYKHSIYLIGPSFVYGQFTCDSNTLANFLQKKINKAEADYQVIPLALSADSDRYNYLKTLETCAISEGDIVLWIESSSKFVNYDIDLKECYMSIFNKVGYDLYHDNPLHSGKTAMEAISDYIWQKLDSGELEEKARSENKNDNNLRYEILRSKSYKEYINGIKQDAYGYSKRIGGIVMNCNPFTLGHRYLIETASKQVDHLYIFVVEENKSFFKFEDRIELVRKGTADLPNVTVLQSGQFIISQNTFSEYFDKANLKDTVVDTSLDVTVFATHIAPTLDINVRFVGEEPLDPVTNQYNQSMKRILPMYNIDVVEIPRKNFGDNPISASRVRKLLGEKNFDEIAKIVPKTTLDFLKNM